jgi:hypothetical protein
MPRSLACVALLAVVASVAVAAPARRPLLVLVEADPWLDSIGSDSPTFALYDDGWVVHRRTTADGRTEYAASTLDETARGALLRAAFGSERKPFDDLEARYEATATTDQPTVTIHHWLGSRRKSVSVYGALRARARDGEDDRAKAPAAFRKAFDALVAFRAPGAKTWLPEKVEVMVWDFSYAKDTPVAWPSEWPGLDHPTTRRRGDQFSLYLDAATLPRLRELLRAKRATQPVVIGGKKWTVAWRFPFPAEELWM